MAAEPFLTDDLLQRSLGDLHRTGLIQCNEVGEWVVVRDFATIDLIEIYEEGSYRLPDTPELALDEPTAVRELLARLAASVREGLDVPLSEIFPPVARSGTETKLPMEKA
jgi:membrane protein